MFTNVTRKNLKGVKMLDTEQDISNTIKEIQHDFTGRIGILAGLKSSRGKSSRFSQGRVWVTDLLNPRRAFFNEKYPELELEIPLERKELMWAGSDFHNTFGRAVYPEAYQEWHINKEDISGRVDIYKDFPIEAKRTTVPIDGDVLTSRPENVEQLGMYSSLLGIDRGHLVYYICTPGSEEIRVYEIVFKDLNVIWNEMKSRCELLLDAWNRDDPSKLPSCVWQGKDCEVEKGGKCDCESLGGKFDYNIVAQVGDIKLIHDESERIGKLISDYMNRPKLNISLWDILTPRKCYFKVTESVDSGAPPDLSKLKWMTEKRAIENAIKYGPDSKFEVEYSEISDERFTILKYEDNPAIICQPGLRSPLSIDKGAISKFLGDSVKMLGMECALAGSDFGRLITYYPKVTDESSRVVVYDIKFTEDGLTSYRGFLTDRLDKIKLAIESGDFSKLPICGKFKCEYKDHRCSYLEKCTEVDGVRG